MNILTLPQLAAFLFLRTPMQLPLIAESSTAAEWNTLLTTIRDLGIAMLALVVLGLAIVGYILDQRNKSRTANAENKVFSDIVTSLSKIIEDYKTMVADSESARKTEKEQSTEALIPIGDGMNRLADILSEMKKQAAFANEQNMKSNMLLGKLSNAYETMSTEGSPILQQVLTGVNTLTTEIRDMKASYDEFMKLAKAFTEAKEACEERAADTGKLPVISQLPPEIAQEGEEKKPA